MLSILTGHATIARQLPEVLSFNYIVMVAEAILLNESHQGRKCPRLWRAQGLKKYVKYDLYYWFWWCMVSIWNTDFIYWTFFIYVGNKLHICIKRDLWNYDVLVSEFIVEVFLTICISACLQHIWCKVWLNLHLTIFIKLKTIKHIKWEPGSFHVLQKLVGNLNLQWEWWSAKGQKAPIMLEK